MMDMRIHSDIIRKEREIRAWSQEHLATVSGLGLRTIQRIEETGSASFESVQALASVLSVNIAELRVENRPLDTARGSVLLHRTILSAVAVSVAAISAVFITRTADAEQVMLELTISLNGEQRGEGLMLTEEGEDAEIRVAELASFVLAPTIRDDDTVSLEIQVLLFQDSDFVLVTQPEIATGNHEEAEIVINSENGDSYSFLVTPHF